MQAPHDAQEHFEDLLASSCGLVDRGESSCVESVLEQIQFAANRRDKNQESSSKKSYEDEQMSKLCRFFAKAKPQSKEDTLAENITTMISSSELLPPMRFSRKLCKAYAIGPPKNEQI